MKLTLKTTLVLVYCLLGVFAKGGGGGGGGRSSGGSTGGSSGRSSGGSTGGSTGGSSSGSRSGTTSGSQGKTPAGVSSRGGTGSFSNGAPPSYSYSNTRNTYTHYSPAYASGYSPASRYGYFGYYNPSLLYFAIMPPFLFLGYSSAYHRYNQNTGYYYAPQITDSGSNTTHVMFNGTANDGKDNNFRYTFDISTNNQFPIVDHAFFASSDPNVLTADFVYRLQFSQLIEFDDTNQNGFYDAGEEIYSVTSLQALNWQNLQVSNITVPSNVTQFYLQTETSANVIYNNTSPQNSSTSPTFNVTITWRTTNLQINNTAPISMQPNSLEYDFTIGGFPTTISSVKPNARLAVTSVLASTINTPIIFDVNVTTPADVAAQIKTNMTYGISIGQYTQGRLEFQNTVNITEVNNTVTDSWGAMIDPLGLAAVPPANLNDWIWSNSSPPTNRTQRILFVTVPGYTGVMNGSINTSYSGFGFLDTDVMIAIESSWAIKNSKVEKSVMIAAMILCVALF